MGRPGLDRPRPAGRPTAAAPPRRRHRPAAAAAGRAGRARRRGRRCTTSRCWWSPEDKADRADQRVRGLRRQGQQIGAVVQVGQSALKKAVRFVSNLDQFLTHRLEVRDATRAGAGADPAGEVREVPGLVERPDGSPIGEIVQANVFGKIRFDLVANGQLVGAIQAENWRAWDFAISDAAGTEVARITKKWEGLARTMFTTADNYVVQVHFRLPEPLASLVVASALTVDTALKQDDRGFN